MDNLLLHGKEIANWQGDCQLARNECSTRNIQQVLYSLYSRIKVINICNFCDKEISLIDDGMVTEGGVALSSARAVSIKDLVVEHSNVFIVPGMSVTRHLEHLDSHSHLSCRCYGSIHHKEKKLIVGPTREQMYDVITNVKDYQAFVPYTKEHGAFRSWSESKDVHGSRG